MALIRAAKQKYEVDSAVYQRVLSFCELYTQWRGAWAAQNPLLAVPRALDVILNPPIFNTVYSGGDPAQLTALFPHLTELWRGRCVTQLVGQVSSSIKFQALRAALQCTPQGNVLDLAVTVFTCQHGLCCTSGRALHWPAAMAHPCAWRHDSLFLPERPRWEIVEKHSAARWLTSVAEKILGCKAWDPEGLVLDKQFDRAVEVVLACGQHPLQVTAQAMDLLDVRLNCGRCAADPKFGHLSRKVMNWRNAVSRHTVLIGKRRN